MMGRQVPGRAEVGETVASFPTYEAAQKAVSALIKADVPAREIAIVGQGLRSVERVTGRLGYATAARSGAINGILLGLFFSAIFVLGNPAVPIQAFVGVVFVGIAVGMLLSLLTYSLVRRRRDFASVMQVVADRYEVTVMPTSIHRAREIVGTHAAAASAAAAPAPSAPSDLPEPAEPPQYGERVDPVPAPPQYGERVDPVPAPPQYGERVDPAPTPVAAQPTPGASELPGEEPRPPTEPGAAEPQGSL